MSSKRVANLVRRISASESHSPVPFFVRPAGVECLLKTGSSPLPLSPLSAPLEDTHDPPLLNAPVTVKEESRTTPANAANSTKP